jgi:hypothetical protein
LREAIYEGHEENPQNNSPQRHRGTEESIKWKGGKKPSCSPDLCVFVVFVAVSLCLCVSVVSSSILCHFECILVSLGTGREQFECLGLQLRGLGEALEGVDAERRNSRDV